MVTRLSRKSSGRADENETSTTRPDCVTRLESFQLEDRRARALLPRPKEAGSPAGRRPSSSIPITPSSFYPLSLPISYQYDQSRSHVSWARNRRWLDGSHSDALPPFPHLAELLEVSVSQRWRVLGTRAAANHHLTLDFRTATLATPQAVDTHH